MHPVYSPCTQREATKKRLGRERAEPPAFRAPPPPGPRFLAPLLFARQRLGRDNGAGHVVLGFPAVLVLAGDDKDLLPGAGLAKPGDIRAVMSHWPLVAGPNRPR